MITALLVFITLLIVGFILYYCFPPIRICGYSMFPTFTDGEILIGRRVFKKNTCKIGEVYVYTPPYATDKEKFVVKRLARIRDNKDGTYYYFLGDNSNDSYDSRYYGYVSSKHIVAKIVENRGCKKW